MELKTLTLNGTTYDRFSKTMTEQQISALDNMFKVCAFTKADVSAEYNAFCTAFGIEGGIVPDEPDIPDEPTVTLSSISVTYSGGDVAVGTAVTDLNGIVVTAHYSDGTSKAVTGYTLSGTIGEGSNTITVSYGGKTATFTVTGVAESGGEETGVSNETTWTDGVAYTFDAVTNEYVNETNGVFTSYNGWNRTPYLYCKGAAVLRAVVNNTTSMLEANNYYNAFYDASKNFVGAFNYQGIDGNTVGAYKDVDVPADAAYFVASHKDGVIGTGTFSASNMLGFVPYGEVQT